VIPAVAVPAVMPVPVAVAGHDAAAETEAAWERAKALLDDLAAARRRQAAMLN